jgi:hypothetical protein
MDNVYTRQTEMMDHTGLGLLPGIALAFVIALFFIAAVTLHTWWAVGLALVGSLGAGVTVAVVVLKTVLAEDEDDA